PGVPTCGSSRRAALGAARRATLVSLAPRRSSLGPPERSPGSTVGTASDRTPQCAHGTALGADVATERANSQRAADSANIPSLGAPAVGAAVRAEPAPLARR
ncbi:MAG: hypothetical protein KDA22_09325, partial [Phycisphaerales bacterium]|nr:hypothetical protein [Phycisphaerales bacterium]